jgi:23S rRNA (uracil1939-C5)-methyltransferase
MDLTILRLGSAGDGAAVTPEGGTVHVARTLPGERVRASRRGASRAACDEILVASPDRIEPACPHFAQCGGCVLQHARDATYAAWKRDLVAQALSRAGFDASLLGPLARTAPGGRRRLDFAAVRVPGGVVLGLHESHSTTVIDIQACPVLHPDLVALLAQLRVVLRSLDALRKRGDVLINLYDIGPDIVLRLDAAATASDRSKLSAFAQCHGVARIACAVGDGAPEVAALLATPTIAFGGTRVAPPPGAFLQASAAGEAAIVAAALAGLPTMTARARIIELFAGIGTLSFPLALHGRVQAFEGNHDAAAALRRAAGGTRVEVQTRDLARQPLQRADFAGVACVVLDPPFAGAVSQMAPLAAAGVPTVIYVSCNPAALARDAALLRAQGYVLAQATPIDQFLWSAQVEAVCVFTRPKTLRAGRG